MNGYILTLLQEIRFGGILQEDHRTGGPRPGGQEGGIPPPLFQILAKLEQNLLH